MSEHTSDTGLGLPGSEPAGRSTRTLLMVGVGGFVAAALGAHLLLGGGTEVEDFVAAPPRPAGVTAPADPAADVVPATYTGVVGKDPFAPLVTEPVPEPVVTEAPVEPTPVEPEPVAPVASGPTLVRLGQGDPATRRAALTLDGAVYDVGIGTVFGERFVLQDVTPEGCATFAHGEEPFTLCPGEERAF